MTLEQAKDQIKSLKTKKSVPAGALIAFLHVGSAVGAGSLGSWALLNLNFGLGAGVALAAILFIGTRFRAINNMSHECLHFSFVESRRANEIFGHIFAILEFSRFLEIRRQHWTHHRSLGDFENDLDFSHLKEYGFDRPLTRATVREHLIRALTLRFLPKYVFFVAYDGEDPVWARGLRTLYIGGLATLAWFFPLPVLGFLVLPYLTSYQIHKYLIDVLDHGGLLANPDPVRKTRNFQLPWFLKWIWFPRNDTYHLVHHLFPFLPVEHFSEAHLVLSQVRSYREVRHSGFEQVKEWLSRREVEHESRRVSVDQDF